MYHLFVIIFVRRTPNGVHIIIGFDNSHNTNYNYTEIILITYIISPLSVSRYTKIILCYSVGRHIPLCQTRCWTRNLFPKQTGRRRGRTAVNRHCRPPPTWDKIKFNTEPNDLSIQPEYCNRSIGSHCHCRCHSVKYETRARSYPQNRSFTSKILFLKWMKKVPSV